MGALFAFFVSFSAFGATLQDALKDYGLHADSAFVILKDQKLKGVAKSQHVIEAEGPAHERLEIKVIAPIDEKLAATMIETETVAVKKVFAAPQTPYMGDIAQAIGGCPHQFGPLQKSVTVAGHSTQAVLGAANAEKAFGACSADQAKFKGALIAYYDAGTKSVWTWRVFQPWTDSKSPLKSDWLAPILSRIKP
jgi:hypothetical protein